MSDHLPSSTRADYDTSRPCCGGMRPLLFCGIALLFVAVAVGGYALATQSDEPNATSDAAADDRDPSDRDGSAAEATESDANGESGAENETGTAENDPPPENPFPNAVPIPSGIFEGGKEWLNVSGDIEIDDLKGKIVLLDFWTYCCINCIHVLPDLKYLEKKFPNELVVIGVHSAKFDNEKETENIRRAVQRYDIEHPVVNDADMLIWRRFGTRAWPTLAVVDPEGNYCGSISGEGHRELLEIVVGKLIAYHRAKGTLDETPVQFALERDKLKPTPLRFPGKVLADGKSQRLFIADTNHNRIVVTDLNGKLLDVIGAGSVGKVDGSYDEATFNHPQGMAVVGDRLFVADTENHLLRVVDLKAKVVKTLAGTGEQDRERLPPSDPLDTPLNSPWDIEHVDGTLYIAMAGPHQIWSYDLKTEKLDVYAGTGREDVVNANRKSAAFAQPSGLANDGKNLFIADSEGSAIRRINVQSGEVDTIAGASDLPLGRSLFEFGDVDGEGGDARLQHPIGVEFHDGRLYIADSYNHKIKRVTWKKDVAEVQSWLGNGKRGKSLDPAEFNEPHGLSAYDGKLYIADTNNHRICITDLKSGEVTELVIDGLNPPKKTTSPPNNSPDVKPTPIARQIIKSGSELNIRVQVNLPKNHKLTPTAPVTYVLSADRGQSLIAADHLDARRRAKPNGSTIDISIPLEKTAGQADLTLTLSYIHCREGKGGLCKLATERWLIPVVVGGETASSELIELTAGDAGVDEPTEEPFEKKTRPDEPAED